MKRRERNKKFLEKIILRLKQLRVQNNVSQKDMEDTIGINIGRIERGASDFNMTTLHKICHYFEITPEEFFRGIK